MSVPGPDAHIYDRMAWAARCSRQDIEDACERAHRLGVVIQTYAWPSVAVAELRGMGFLPPVASTA